tara:strand:- start:28604 stop:29632 length:1029 start_codon:yes stop_codon:yes gene_type:complete
MSKSPDMHTLPGVLAPDASAPDVSAFLFDGHGGGQAIALDACATVALDDKAFVFVWVHVQHDDPDSYVWLQQCGIDQFVIDALTAEETRPRCTVHQDGAVVNLRGINLNPGAEPEDMISIRFWLEEKRVIGVWVRPLLAINDIFDAIERKLGPVSPGDLMAKLALRLADRAEPTVASLNERIDAMEELVIDEQARIERGHLAEIRRDAIVLRRFMFPQRDALTTLEIEDLEWLTQRDRSRIREAAERVTRLAEELDAIRDRAQVVHDQIMDNRAEAMNRSMLVLSVVAVIFLPLGFLTGLLGINVGGIPGANDPWAFLIVCGLLLLVAALQIWLFKRVGILR